VGRRTSELSILLTGDDQITELNERYLKRAGATNVLSFGMNEKSPDGVELLGDIVVSVDTAKKQAETRGVDLIDEIMILIVHGLLHLLGHIHDPHEGASRDDMVKMELEEKRLLSLIGIIIED